MSKLLRTFCLSWTTALQKSDASLLWHSLHIWWWTTYSTTNTCWRMAELITLRARRNTNVTNSHTEPRQSSHLLLYREFDLYSLWVGLCPYEPSIHKVNLAQTLQVLETNGQQLSGLQGTGHPGGRMLEIPVWHAANTLIRWRAVSTHNSRKGHKRQLYWCLLNRRMSHETMTASTVWTDRIFEE